MAKMSISPVGMNSEHEKFPIQKNHCVSSRRYSFMCFKHTHLILDVHISWVTDDEGDNVTLGGKRSTAPAIVVTIVAAPVSSISAPFHWNAYPAGHVGCFCTLRKEESKDGLRVRKKLNDRKHRLRQPGGFKTGKRY